MESSEQRLLNKRDPFVDGEMIYTKDVSVLLNKLQLIKGDTPLGWIAADGTVVIGKLWGRVGAFVPKISVFTDAFDHQSYETEVWDYVSETTPAENMTMGLEIHAISSFTEPEKISNAVVLDNVSGLRDMLARAEEDGIVFSTEENFELDGALTPFIRLWLYHDKTQNGSWLILQ